MAPHVDMEYRPVDIAGLELGAGAPFRFRWSLPGEEGNNASDAALAASVSALGIISPPVLSDEGDSIEVVSGFRRIAAARMAGSLEINALVISARDETRAAVIPVWLESSLHGRPLSEMELIDLAAKISCAAGDHLPDFLPHLSAVFGRKITPDILGKLAGLAHLKTDIRLAIHEGRLSSGDLLQLGTHPGIALETAAEMLASSGLSRGARREAVRGMLAVADRGKTAFEDFAGEYDPDAVPLDEAIRTLTHPEMTDNAAFINRLIEDIELPQSASVRFPPNLEGGSCTVEIRIRNEDELRISLSRLAEALEDGLFEEMLKVLRGRS